MAGQRSPSSHPGRVAIGNPASSPRWSAPPMTPGAAAPVRISAQPFVAGCVLWLSSSHCVARAYMGRVLSSARKARRLRCVGAKASTPASRSVCPPSSRGHGNARRGLLLMMSQDRDGTPISANIAPGVEALASPRGTRLRRRLPPVGSSSQSTGRACRRRRRSHKRELAVCTKSRT